MISIFLTLNGIRIACSSSGLKLYLTIDIHVQVPVLSKTLAKKCIEEFNQDEFEFQPDSEMMFFWLRLLH